jgi:1A family penicillin-binding protein
MHKKSTEHSPFAKKATHSLSHVNHLVEKMGTHTKTNAIRSVSEFGGLKKLILRSVVVLLVCFIFLVGSLIIWASTLNIPTFEEFMKRKVAGSTQVYDKTEKVLLYDFHDSIRRTTVTISEVSPFIQNAFISIEDSRFYKHHGVDFIGTTRAITKTMLSKLGLRKGRLEGGSTITQQVIKNTLLDSNKTGTRKVKEWLLAYKLEQKLSKSQILEHYVNEAPFGGPIYGIETASQSFFGKSAKNVTLAEAAYLAAIPNAPSLYSPYGNNFKRLTGRQQTILNKMLEQKLISKQDFENAKKEIVMFKPKEDRYAKSLHFVEYVHQILAEKYGEDMITTGGLRVITTLDYDIQKKAENIVASEARANNAAYNASNMGAIAIDPKNGNILAMVGSRGYDDPEIDGMYNTTTALRQPGSSFKPFVYAKAFESGYSDSSMLYDVPTQFSSSCSPSSRSSVSPCYAPDNYDNAFKGPISLRNALGQSRNIPAVKLLYLVGIQNAIDLAKSLGITSLKNKNIYGLTLVLGGGEVSLLEMTNAYASFGNDGVHFSPNAIEKILDKTGKVIFEAKNTDGENVLSSNSARMIASVLSDNSARTPLFGATSFMYDPKNPSLAAKSGTTNNNKDAWVIGFTPTAAVGIWSGNNDNKPMKKGSSISGKAWRAIMDEALKKQGVEQFKAFGENNDPLLETSESDIPKTDLETKSTFADILKPNDSQYTNWSFAINAWGGNTSTSSVIQPTLPSSVLNPITPIITTPLLSDEN